MHNGDREPVVVKIGSECLFDIVDGSFFVHHEFLMQKGNELKFMYENGAYPILVTSGAIPLGMHKLGLNPAEKNSGKYDDIDLQTFAAKGQPILQELWDQYTNMECGQFLVNKKALGNSSNTLDSLMRMSKYGMIPIINENDAMYKEEVHGDNDLTSAMIADIVDAKKLIIQCASIEGFYIADKIVMAHIDNITEDHFDLCSGESLTGSGTGMNGKLEAIQYANKHGVTAILSNKRANLSEVSQRKYEGLRTVFGDIRRL